MRIAVISDVHGNLTALDAVIADLKTVRPDLILHGGDLAANGCQPAEVIDRVVELGCAGVLGNTDEMLWTPERLTQMEAEAPKLRALWQVLFRSVAPATRELIGERRTEWLQRLPIEHRHQDVVLLHASPGDLWKAPLHNSDDTSLERTYGKLNAGIVVYCHIHRPFVRRLKKMTVCNSGSVGLPYDGDPRASYLLVEDNEPTIRRVEYDVDGEVSRLLASNYPYKQWLAQIRRCGVYVPPPVRD